MIAPSLRSQRPNRNQAWWQTALTWAYAFVLGLMLLVTLIYALARMDAGKYTAESLFATVGLLFLIGIFVFALYFAEGSEIAVTTVLDRDEDELDLGNTSKRLRELRDGTDHFVSGRQFIVVVLVVLFAAICEAFARNSPPAPSSWHVSWLFTSLVVNLYSFVFPILTALWLSQLYSKFVAQRRPATFFRTTQAQFVVLLSTIFGRNLMLGAVSTKLAETTLKGRPDDPRAPSRTRCYEALAAFRDGFGFERAEINLTVDPNDGSLHVQCKFDVRAYAAGGKRFLQSDEWDGPILDEPGKELKLSMKVPRPASIGGPHFADGRKSMDWDFTLSTPLALHEEFQFEISYWVGKGGVQPGRDAIGEFFYECHKYPVRQLRVSVRLSDSSTFILSHGKVIPNVSDDSDTNDREAARHQKFIVGNAGGYDYEILYPMMGGTYNCQWKIAQKV